MSNREWCSFRIHKVQANLQYPKDASHGSKWWYLDGRFPDALSLRMVCSLLWSTLLKFNWLTYITSFNFSDHFEDSFRSTERAFLLLDDYDVCPLSMTNDVPLSLQEPNPARNRSSSSSQCSDPSHDCDQLNDDSGETFCQPSSYPSGWIRSLLLEKVKMFYFLEFLL